ncbi:ParA family protein [Hyphomicrobium sp. GJ21]|uniref:ParA family protein n=1 Tax=Hyphomicrobium sp. GJ21 TaxID=113574 RepID=UPI00131F07F4|nr:ParA family protein [Hyphomicrobium sp. GJ21]
MTNHKPPCIIAFASSKGGAGKSTNCLNVAGALAAMGNSVLVVDCDISETLHRWYQDNPTAQTIKGLSVEKPPETNFGDYMRAIARNESDKDFVLFDLPGQFTKDLLWVATAAHLVVTPCKVSEPDIMQANKLYLELIEIGRDYNKTIVQRILFNEYPNSISKHETAFLEDVKTSVLPNFNTVIRRRGAYTESFGKGTTPHYASPFNPSAIAEIDALVGEIYDLLNTQTQNQEESIAA